MTYQISFHNNERTFCYLQNFITIVVLISLSIKSTTIEKISFHTWNMPHICYGPNNAIKHLKLNGSNTDNRMWSIITHPNRSSTFNRLISGEPISMLAYMKRSSSIKNPLITATCTSNKSNKDFTIRVTSIGSNGSFTLYVPLLFSLFFNL